MNRRELLRLVSAGLMGIAASPPIFSNPGQTDRPNWLKDYKKAYKTNPRIASQQWFQEAKYGMFIHLNLASLCENGKWDYIRWTEGEASDRSLDFVGYTRQEYEAAEDRDELLFQQYTLPDFDTDRICQLAVKAEMKYITFTTQHLGRCYNFHTSTSEFTSLHAPCGRDLVSELAEACTEHQLGLFFYLPPEYAQTKNETQIKHNRMVIRELLTQYGPVAGIWFDGIGKYHNHPEDYEYTQETYALVRALQPHALISFKGGAFCTEDFISPEHFMLPFPWEFDTPGRRERYDIRKKRWHRQNAKLWEECAQYLLREVNTVMQECYNRDAVHVRSGWINDESARHLSASEVYYWLKYARYTGSNLLMNIGPRADGSIHPDDYAALTQVGEIIREKGWPDVVHEVEMKK